jgi:hypothetical protein
MKTFNEFVNESYKLNETGSEFDAVSDFYDNVKNIVSKKQAEAIDDRYDEAQDYLLGALEIVIQETDKKYHKKILDFAKAANDSIGKEYTENDLEEIVKTGYINEKLKNVKKYDVTKYKEN